MPEVDDWGFGQPSNPVTYRVISYRSEWPAEVARFALSAGVVAGVLVALVAAAIGIAILLAGLAEWLLLP